MLTLIIGVAVIVAFWVIVVACLHHAAKPSRGKGWGQ